MIWRWSNVVLTLEVHTSKSLYSQFREYMEYLDHVDSLCVSSSKLCTVSHNYEAKRQVVKVKNNSAAPCINFSGAEHVYVIEKYVGLTYEIKCHTHTYIN